MDVFADYHSDSEHSENSFDEQICTVLEGNKDTESKTASEEVMAVLDIVMKDYIDTPEMEKANQCKEELLKRTDINDWYNFQFQKLQTLLNDILQPELKKIENKHFTEFYSRFHSYLNSDEYKNSALLNEMKTDICHDICTTVMFELQRQLIQNKANAVQVSESDANIFPNLKNDIQMSGRGKVRYIGGYVVAKCRYKASRLLQRNIFVPGRTAVVRSMQRQINILDQFIISEAELREETFFEETLEETTIKQNIRGSLTHINDKCFEFFEFVEKKIRFLLSSVNLMIHSQNLFQFSMDSLNKDPSILQDFINLYCYTRPAVEPEEESTLDDMIVKDVVENKVTETVCELENILNFFLNLFLKVAVSQFRKNYMNALKVEKSQALRKKIMKQGRKRNKPITVHEIQEDKSGGKEISKLRLKALAMEDHQFYKKFTKQELRDIGKLYELSFSTKKTVMEIGETILKVILDSNQESAITLNESSDAVVPSQSLPPEKAIPPSKSLSKPPSTAASQSYPVRKGRRKGAPKSRDHMKRTKTKTYSKGRKRKTNPEEEDSEKSDETAFCSMCGKLSQDDQDCICCDECDSWYHRSCVGLEDEKLWAELTSEDSKYSCPLCS
jgi:hypothetical protein